MPEQSRGGDRFSWGQGMAVMAQQPQLQQQQSRRFPLTGHQALYPAVFASILLHVLIFSYSPTVINTSQSSRTLRVLLNKPL
ncbi:MAG: hypothetical protein VX709_00895, partial [Pseudomonadota bacterium]|nr:hypothetical protein [Pseudomonadota bacterium]